MARPERKRDGGTQPRGASDASISTRAMLTAWWHHHQESAQDSIQHLLKAPLQNLVTALVIGIALALPTLLALALDNFQALGERWDGAPRLSVFVNRKAPGDAIEHLRQQLQAAAGVTRVSLVTPAQGLAEFERNTGLHDTLELLDENPLPPVLVAELQTGQSTDTVSQLRNAWQSLPHVDSVQADMEWLQKMHHMMTIGEKATIALAALLGLGALLSVGNTIRLSIENRRAEIVVEKLVGATDAFVRRPFLYSGFWYGLSGGVVAIILVQAGYQSIAQPVAELAALYQSDFHLHSLNLSTGLQLLLTGVTLGMLGSWLAVGQHLHDMRPR